MDGLNDIDLKVRHGIMDDLAFFYSAALKSYRYGSPYTSRIPDDIYAIGQRRLLDALLQRSRLVVATYEELLIGFAMSEGPFLHYTYVKLPFRRFGVARQLWQALGLVYPCQVSHWTFPLAQIALKDQRFLYNPYLLQGVQYEEPRRAQG